MVTTPAAIISRRFPLGSLVALKLEERLIDALDDHGIEIVTDNAWWFYVVATGSELPVEIPMPVVVLENGAWTGVWSRGPFEVDDVVRFDLYPSPRAMARFILDVAAAEGHPDFVQLTSDRGDAAIGREMSGDQDAKGRPYEWRVSFFDDEGPVGHRIGHDLLRLVKETWTEGYKTYVNPLKENPVGYRERIPGGLAAGHRPAEFDPQELAMGIQVEMEHTFDRGVAREIAMDHLMEDPRYYTKLKMAGL